ncbi:hypothetical protein K469DRAFT_751233 [Zopfia rhizophila CBS 207.26]|uniref:Uncharacterized protein n=1 Tax=Zopfia rhizophila CBS 207.26 TaxID=1314779 RepID=A0A6A6E014_9PEZI|nr:hypothetical protein K469DRAFT_751233 [Zopfia rhizophila CBS 207.26]
MPKSSLDDRDIVDQYYNQAVKSSSTASSTNIEPASDCLRKKDNDGETEAGDPLTKRHDAAADELWSTFGTPDNMNIARVVSQSSLSDCRAQRGSRNDSTGLERKEETIHEAVDAGVGADCPKFHRMWLDDLLYQTTSPYRAEWNTSTVDQLPNSKYPTKSSIRQWLHLHWTRRKALRRKFKYHSRTRWRKFKYCLGTPRMTFVIMGVLCTASLAANIIAVSKCGSTERLPVIDSNFWSALSQSNIATAAIYSIIIPLLRGGDNPVPRQWRWIFNLLLLLSIFSAVLATCVYPWNGQTSIVAAFISSATQLAVTLQMIFGARSKIDNLEYEIEELGGHRRRNRR